MARQAGNRTGLVRRLRQLSPLIAGDRASANNSRVNERCRPCGCPDSAADSDKGERDGNECAASGIPELSEGARSVTPARRYRTVLDDDVVDAGSGVAAERNSSATTAMVANRTLS